MLDKSSTICSILKDQREITLFNMTFGEMGFRKITSFTSGKEAYEIAIRQQFPLFVTRMEVPDLSGLALIQKLRATGNYGQEIHLFVCEKLTPEIMNVLHEFDIAYVLTQPVNKATISAKFSHMIQSENSLSPFEIKYREARAALASGIVDMADALAKELHKEQPFLDKVLLLMGDIATKRGDTLAMSRHYEAAKKANPASAVALHKLAGVLTLNGKDREAAALLDEAAKVNPYNIKLLENAGLSHLKVKDFEKADVYAGKLKTVDSGNKVAGEVKAQVKIAKGDFGDLAATLKDSHDEKEIVSFLNNAGVKLAKGDDVKGALRMYQSCLQQLENSKYIYAVHYNIGLAYKKLNDTAKAISHFDTAVRLKPDFEKAASAAAELRSAGAKAKS